jgi:hypothetical protein
VTSALEKIPPMATAARDSSTIPRSASAVRPRGAPAGRAGGSVSVSRRNHSAPIRTSPTATTSTSTGSVWVAISVAISGPRVKIASSRMDSSEYAVPSSGRPASTYDHRARTSEPTDR